MNSGDKVLSHSDTLGYWENRLVGWKRKEEQAKTEQDKFICRTAIEICKKQIMIVNTGKLLVREYG